ncbi:hypothetical protein [Rubrivivax gelatinosus]|uniref:TonB family protein n=1 Tax=Rubrivivax gelatinosus TaxID=28068 RepID=A0A4R2M441_RUBGE|nr:hypothetical protein [Rubrivivax gelatinosus]MBK1686567.1 hypothetical protein [Rubrivivax gelatinosus]TCP00900.1 hypothetical protein EV684_111104 [Rubrivivax gelatinosus]
MNRLPPLTASARLRHAAAVAVLAALAFAGPARAQFASVPAPVLDQPPAASAAEHEKQYRVDAARHVYAAYPARIYKGRLPPLLYSVMVVETEIDAMGQVAGVQVVRKPAADEVAPWVVAMIKRAAPYPAPARLGVARFTEIWLVDKSGRFQVDALTEGQR